MPPWQIADIRCWFQTEPHHHGSEICTDKDKWHEGFQEKITESIRREGLREPISAAYCRKCNRYDVWDGGHRLEAYRRLGLPTIPAKVSIEDHEDDKECQRVARSHSQTHVSKRLL